MSKNQQINYTTKPINLPLSTEKEYVLVYVEGYKNANSLNKKILNDCDLTKPFKFDSISNGSGFINDFDSVSVINIGREEYLFFYEVIRQPQPNEFNTDSIAVTEQEEEEFNTMANSSEIPNSSEWSNGDECVYMNHKVIQKFVGFCPKREGYCYIQAPTFEINFVEVSKLSKPETEAERNERERLEAGYDLYCEWHQTIWLDIIGMSSIEDFIHDERVCKSWLAIVDKTNYRLTK